MKPRVERFQGERLRQARKVRGWTLESLSQMSNLSSAAISQFERNTHYPMPKTLNNLARILDFPTSYFIRPIPAFSENIIWFRAISGAAKKEIERIRIYNQWVKEIVSFMQRYIVFPQIRLPEFDLPKNPRDISSEDIENMANETRKYWGLGDGPISNMANLVESFGALVIKSDLQSEKLESFSQWDLYPYIFVGTSKDVTVRFRLNIAHELAHLIIHKNIDDIYYKNDHKLMEEQAWHFAGAFMLPATSFVNEIYSLTLSDFERLKPSWKISIAAMIKRSEKMGLFRDENSLRRVWVIYNKNKWRYGEPYDDEIPFEKPSILREGMKMMVERCNISKSQILSEGFCGVHDIEKLFGLPGGYLDNKVDIPKIRPRLRLIRGTDLL